MDEDAVAQKLIADLRESFDFMNATTNEELMSQIENAVFQYAQETQDSMTSARIKSLVERIFHAFRGLDVLQPLIDDPVITEIMINNHEEIYIEREGEISKAPVQFNDVQKLEDIIQTIVSKVDRVVNEASPIVDARLQDGSRVNVVLPPIALKGPVMTIRKFPGEPLTIDDLIEKGTLTEEAAEFLQHLVQAKYNIFVSGGTGSGKTTFLNVLSNFIPKKERMITIEDSAELQIHSVPNLVGLEARNANTEGKGQISIRELIRTSLRMRPDRVIVGEVRGEEALDMLQAMNTGHDGSLSTGHANSTIDMLSRLETMVLSGAPLPVQVIRQQISSALDIMVHLARLRDHSRRVVAISEMLEVKDGDIKLNPIFEFVEEGEREDGRIIGSLKPTGNLQSQTKLDFAGIKIEAQI